MSEELKPCPFCGEKIEPPKSRQASTDRSEGFVAFAACYCGGYSATAHKMGRGNTEAEAIQEVIAIWNRRAQPVEAEGVVPVVCYLRAFQDGTPHWTEDCVCEDAVYPNHDGDETYSMPMVRQADHLAALSAVTAERDRLREDRDSQQRVCIAEMEKVSQLRAEVEGMRVALLGIASVNPAERGIEWAKSYASDGLKGAGSELYARWLDAFKEAEALRSLLSKSFPIVEAHAGASHMLEGFRPARNKWDDLVDGIRAAMAAKEA